MWLGGTRRSFHWGLMMVITSGENFATHVSQSSHHCWTKFYALQSSHHLSLVLMSEDFNFVIPTSASSEIYCDQVNQAHALYELPPMSYHSGAHCKGSWVSVVYTQFLLSYLCHLHICVFYTEYLPLLYHHLGWFPEALPQTFSVTSPILVTIRSPSFMRTPF